MRSFLACFFLLLSSGFLSGQKDNHFNIITDFGLSYSPSDNGFKRPWDHAGFIGINYELALKGQVLKFNPGIQLRRMDYHGRITDTRYANIEQNLIGLSADMLLKLSKKIIVRVGLFCNKHANTFISIVEKTYNNGNYYAGNTEVEKGYHAADFQAGFVVGLAVPFKLFKRTQKFNIKLTHIASPVVSSDYVLSRALVGTESKVLSVKERPLILTLGFDISLKRLKKKKKDEEEE